MNGGLASQQSYQGFIAWIFFVYPLPRLPSPTFLARTFESTPSLNAV
jgi:hypothetical protein